MSINFGKMAENGYILIGASLCEPHTIGILCMLFLLQFLQFLVLDFGLVHYGSNPFNSLSNLVPNIYFMLKIMLV